MHVDDGEDNSQCWIMYVHTCVMCHCYVMHSWYAHCIQCLDKSRLLHCLDKTWLLLQCLGTPRAYEDFRVNPAVAIVCPCGVWAIHNVVSLKITVWATRIHRGTQRGMDERWIQNIPKGMAEVRWAISTACIESLCRSLCICISHCMMIMCWELCFNWWSEMHLW